MARSNLFVAASRIEEPGALERLTPPWEHVEMIERAAGIRDGACGAMWVYMGPLRLRWTFEHNGYIEGRQFRDVQTSGPFRRWEHTHLFIPEGPEACKLEDRIEYELPFGALGDFAAGWVGGGGMGRGCGERG